MDYLTPSQRRIVNIIERETRFCLKKRLFENRTGFTRIIVDRELEVISVEFIDVLFLSDYDFLDITMRPFICPEGHTFEFLYFEVKGKKDNGNFESFYYCLETAYKIVDNIILNYN